jgi:hypothetical protein
LVVQVKGAAVDTSGAGAIGGVATVYGEMRLDALERVHVWSPFDEGETIEHGKNTDVNAVILKLEIAREKK